MKARDVVDRIEAEFTEDSIYREGRTTRFLVTSLF